jgi:hypothetical protein
MESTHPSIIDRLSSALEKMKPTLGDFDQEAFCSGAHQRRAVRGF